MEMFEAKLEALILNKAFEELSGKERAYVLEHLSETAYTNYHLILNSDAFTMSKEEEALAPNANTPDILKERFNDQFKQPAGSFFFNIFQPFNLYGSLAIFGIAAILTVFFILNRPGDEVVPQMAKNNVSRAAPVKPKANPDKRPQPTPALVPVSVSTPVKVALKKHVVPAMVKIEEDPLANNTDELPGLNVYEPILCLDIELKEQVPGLNDRVLSN